MRIFGFAMGLVFAVAATEALAVPVQVQIRDDGFGSETSFEIATRPGGVIVESIAAGTIPDFVFTTTNFDFDLSPGDYTFTINDFFGDGITAPGGYSLLVDGVTIFDVSNFTGFSQSQEFSVAGAAAAIPLPATLPLILAGLGGLALMRRRG
ncbi:MAG: VPLPA-CTERM sorting domain-containing protein [Pseudomonadota bacterium]